ncbi:MAG: immunoglobulin domain-containing protein, partial [Bacteroidota bacterium]
GACAGESTITRTWTATDACGNEVIQTQVITVIDPIAPLLANFPNDTTVACNALADTAIVVANDACDPNPIVVAVRDSLTAGSCAGNYTISRIYTASDACGNEVRQIQTITVADDEAPVVDAAPNDTTVICGQVPAAAVLTATDNCDTPLVDYQFTEVPGACGGESTITRTWRATDACGNVTVQTQVITVIDIVAPSFVNFPNDTAVLCSTLPDTAVVIATDICDPNPIVVTVRDSLTAGSCAGSYTISRIYTASDACGNAITQVQTITVADTVDPVVDVAPSDTTVVCGQVPVAAILTATDNCDNNVVVSYNELEIPGACAGESVITRTWTATDVCGNEVIQTQLIRVIDTIAPVVLQVPNDTIVDCSAVPTQPTLVATDNCGNAVTINTQETRVDGVCPNTYTLIREWIATDDCGNSNTYVQNVTVINCTPTISLVIDPDAPCEFESTTLTVSFIGTAYPTPVYEWQHSTDNGTSWTSIDTTTTGSLSIDPVRFGVDEGWYRVVVANTLTDLGSVDCNVISPERYLNVLEVQRTTLDETICEGQSYTIGLSNYILNGTYVDTLSTVAGCDSIITLNLTVLRPIRDTLRMALCEGDSFRGIAYTSDAQLIDTLGAANGCDSISVVEIEVSPVYAETVQAEICPGDSLFLAGAYQTTAGNYVDTLSTVSGCDSIITTQLSLYPEYVRTFTTNICPGDSLFLAGAYQTLAGTYTDSLTTTNGCDSVILTTLAIWPAYQDTVFVELCEGGSITAGGAIQTTSGIYFDSLQTTSGCDSIIVTDLTVHPVYR